MKKLTLIILLLLCHCSLIQGTKNHFGKLLVSILSGVGFYAGEDSVPPPVDIVPAPTLTIPSNSIFASLENSLKVSKAPTETPTLIQGKMVPIGDVYDIGLNFETISGISPDDAKSVIFAEPITFEYKYNKASLAKSGFIEEFTVYYFDVFSKTWIPMDHVIIDLEKQTIQVSTNHFTPFVLTALPTPTNTGVALAPQCLSNVMPITGEGSAQWTQLDAHFKYYKDRNYTITPNNDFYELGFNRSFGISTCNGGTPQAGSAPCGSFAEHKHNTNMNYINFVAEEDLTVYIMYDRRGASDATWLASENWILDTHTIQTTDAVGSYKVYYKEFLKGNLVALHGNRVGLPTNTAVDTNYWVAIKRKENTPGTCLASAENFQNPITHITTIPGQTSSSLLWRDIDLNSVSNLIIRRKKNSPPSSPADGLPVFGEEISTIGFKDTLLDENATYYYSIFALNTEGALSLAQTVLVTTGLDTDNDGIRDSFESDGSCPAYSWFPVCTTNPNLADSDSDGIDDLTEIIQQTNPNDPDINPPTISSFTLLSESPTYFPIAKFSANATDNVPGKEIDWLLTKTSLKPKFDHPNWQTGNIAPSFKEFTGIELNDLGNQNFYIWAKDKAGNISNLHTPVTINVLGFKYPEYYLSFDEQKLKFYKQNLVTNELDYLGSETLNVRGVVLSSFFSPDNQYLFLYDSDDSNEFAVERTFSIFRIDFENRKVTLTQRIENVNDFIYYSLSKNGDYVYSNSLASPIVSLYSFDKNLGKINLIRAVNVGPSNYEHRIHLVHPKSSRLYIISRDGYYILDPITLEIQFSASLFNPIYSHPNSFFFHPNGKNCFIVISPSIYACDVDEINGAISNLRPIPETSDTRTIVYSKNGKLVFTTNGIYSNFITYSVNESNGSLNVLQNLNVPQISNIQVDPTTHFVYAKYFKVMDGQNTIGTKVYKINQDTGLLSEVQDIGPSPVDGSYNQIVSAYDNTNPPVEVSLTQTNQLGLLQKDGAVKYPAPNTMLVGAIMNRSCGLIPPTVFGDPCQLYPKTGQPLIDRSIGNTVQLSKTISDPAFTRCNKEEFNFSELFSVNDSSNNPINVQSLGDFWNQKLTFDFKLNDPNLNLNYSLTDNSSQCLSTSSKVTNQSITFSKKKIALKDTVLLPAGSPPPQNFTLANLKHYQSGNKVLPLLSKKLICQVERYDCSLLGLNLLNLFCNRQTIDFDASHWILGEKTPAELCAFVVNSLDRTKFPNPLFRLGYIKSISYTYETRWLWDNFEISDP